MVGSSRDPPPCSHPALLLLSKNTERLGMREGPRIPPSPRAPSACLNTVKADSRSEQVQSCYVRPGNLTGPIIEKRPGLSTVGCHPTAHYTIPLLISSYRSTQSRPDIYNLQSEEPPECPMPPPFPSLMLVA